MSCRVTGEIKICTVRSTVRRTFPHLLQQNWSCLTDPTTYTTMGWLPSFLGGEKSNDPLTKLDPKLREFLEKESPVKYSKKEEAPTPTPAHPESAPAPSDSSAVPPASLYQDGRYAHLWKNYKPLAQVEEEGSSDHDKLMNVLDGYKERKAAISKAAMENCAIQQEEWINCMKHGSWSDQLQMCRHQVRRYERCYTMQSVSFCRIQPAFNANHDSDFSKFSATELNSDELPKSKKISRCMQIRCSNECYSTKQQFRRLRRTELPFQCLSLFFPSQREKSYDPTKNWKSNGKKNLTNFLKTNARQKRRRCVPICKSSRTLQRMSSQSGIRKRRNVKQDRRQGKELLGTPSHHFLEGRSSIV